MTPTADIPAILPDFLPDALILCDLQELQEPVAQALTEYLENEGQIFLMLNEESRDSVHEHFLSRLQLPYQLDETESENRLTLLSWIDFEHPIFVPFQGAQYNDFSSVHFYQFTQLNVQPGTNESEREHLKVLARFESTGEHDPPAILEFQLGQGTVMLWTFTPSLRDTNLPRNVKFLPLLFETLNYLAGAAEEQAQLIVGASVPAIPIQEMDAENWLLLKPGEDEVLSITTMIQSLHNTRYIMRDFYP